jgi:hypothetical protein
MTSTFVSRGETATDALIMPLTDVQPVTATSKKVKCHVAHSKFNTDQDAPCDFNYNEEDNEM